MFRTAKLTVVAAIAIGLYFGLNAITFDVQLNGQQATGVDRVTLITLAILLLFAVLTPLLALVTAPALYGAELVRRAGAKLHTRIAGH